MKFFSVLIALISSSLWAHANPSGTWRSEEGETGGHVIVTIAPCASDSSKFCGTIDDVVGNDNTSIIGETIITDMTDRGNGNYNGGQIWAPDQDRWYRSKMKLNNDGTLRVSGCVAGGIICRGQTWTRL